MSKKKSAAARSERARAAAERAAEVRRQQERAERRRRVGIGSAVVVAVALVVGALVWAQSSDDAPVDVVAPAGAVDEFTVPYGPDDAPRTVEVWSDFLCPACGAFEQLMNDELTAAADAGDLQLRYHAVAILDRASPTDYSTRAANAYAVVLDAAGPEVAKRFHDLLFVNQPVEGGGGEPSDDQLVALAVEAGAAEDDVRRRIEELAFAPWVEASTGEFADRGYTGTPTVVVDGEQVSGQTMDEVVQAVRSRLAG